MIYQASLKSKAQSALNNNVQKVVIEGQPNENKAPKKGVWILHEKGDKKVIYWGGVKKEEASKKVKEYMLSLINSERKSKEKKSNKPTKSPVKKYRNQVAKLVDEKTSRKLFGYYTVEEDRVYYFDYRNTVVIAKLILKIREKLSKEQINRIKKDLYTVRGLGDPRFEEIVPKFVRDKIATAIMKGQWQGDHALYHYKNIFKFA